MLSEDEEPGNVVQILDICNTALDLVHIVDSPSPQPPPLSPQPPPLSPQQPSSKSLELPNPKQTPTRKPPPRTSKRKQKTSPRIEDECQNNLTSDDQNHEIEPPAKKRNTSSENIITAEKNVVNVASDEEIIADKLKKKKAVPKRAAPKRKQLKVSDKNNDWILDSINETAKTPSEITSVQTNHSNAKSTKVTAVKVTPSPTRKSSRKITKKRSFDDSPDEEETGRHSPTAVNKQYSMSRPNKKSKNMGSSGDFCIAETIAVETRNKDDSTFIDVVKETINESASDVTSNIDEAITKSCTEQFENFNIESSTRSADVSSDDSVNDSISADKVDVVHKDTNQVDIPSPQHSDQENKLAEMIVSILSYSGMH